MLNFCIKCGNRTNVSDGAFVCPACNHSETIRGTVKSTKYSRLKEVDDVLNDANTWKNVDCTEVKCPKCEHGQAYFMQVQIRSADEPSTTFYRCVSCTHNWKEN
uniref:DNA-directed RNA polymerase subunit n=1 Tax=Aceria tosichella TaxID=561515 RepID=A0A6G1SHL0_9ACAR